MDLLQQSEREADFAPTVKLAESIMQKKAPINTHVQVHFESKQKKKKKRIKISNQKIHMQKNLNNRFKKLNKIVRFCVQTRPYSSYLKWRVQIRTNERGFDNFEFSLDCLKKETLFPFIKFWGFFILVFFFFLGEHRRKMVVCKLEGFK